MPSLYGFFQKTDSLLYWLFDPVPLSGGASEIEVLIAIALATRLISPVARMLTGSLISPKVRKMVRLRDEIVADEVSLGLKSTSLYRLESLSEFTVNAFGPTWAAILFAHLVLSAMDPTLTVPRFHFLLILLTPVMSLLLLGFGLRFLQEIIVDALRREITSVLLRVQRPIGDSRRGLATATYNILRSFEADIRLARDRQSDEVRRNEDENFDSSTGADSE